MTVSSTLEARIRDRAPSSAPADLAFNRFSDLSHRGYGTGWGVVRGLLGATGMSQRRATLAHEAAIYGAAQVTLPALEVAPPSIYRGLNEVAIDALQHAVHAAATGLAYAAIAR